VNIQAEGQNHKVTFTGINAAGNQISFVVTRTYDGMPHPPLNNPNFDADAYTRVDASTVIVSNTKAGKLVGTLTIAVSPDGKTQTATTIGAGPNGPQVNNVTVFDKQ
jgi:hypothetical protein